MMMKITQLRTYWDAGEAQMVIEFLDELRDVLWTAYGQEIIAMHAEEADNENATTGEVHDGRQTDLEFDDKIEF
jgi:hypothetical protein